MLKVELKYSGVEWVEMIPSHWKISKIKYVSQLENGSTPKSNNKEYWGGSIKWFTANDFKHKDTFGYLHEQP